MAQATQNNPVHVHGANCGHTAITHDGHTDYLDHGKLCHMESGSKTSDHVLAVSQKNPDRCTPNHNCGGHAVGHVHGPDCGHEAVPHGDHIDYLVNGHLHHPHDGHCDDHGPVAVKPR